MKQPLALLALTIVLACGQAEEHAPLPEDPTRAEAQAPAEVPVDPDDPAGLLAAADRRTLDPRLPAGLAATAVERRRAAAWALARLHDPEAADSLRRALRDPDSDVRDAGSFGLGALESEAPDGTAGYLAASLAAESSPGLRRHRLRDLGRLAGPRHLPAYSAALVADTPDERAGACEGLYELSRRGIDISSTLVSVGARLAPAEDTEVRLVCAHTLARAPASSDLSLAAAIEAALTDEDAEVRRFAFRAYGRLSEPSSSRLAEGSRDPDWRVAVEALRAFGRTAPNAERGPGLASIVLERRFEDAVDDRTLREGPPLHILHATLDAVAPLARSGPVFDLASELLTRSRTLRGPSDADRGGLHCHLARLVDRGRGWPDRLATCGLGHVDEVDQRVAVAGLLGELEGAEPQRLGRLRRLGRHELPRVRQAAYRALAQLRSPEASDALVGRLARETDPGAIAAACESLEQRLGPDHAPIPPEPLNLALGRLDCAVDVEPCATCLGLVERADVRRIGLEPLQRAAVCPHPVVRDKARALLNRWELPPPDAEIPPPPRPVEAADLRGRPAQRQAVLETERGPIHLRLLVAQAPTTTLRFTELASAGVFDRLTFHRIVPAFVAQGGDPGGDGYGGPGWTQRCENARTRYRRGTVGMALAGRDTGGSQFFLTHGAEPHLEGRYTAFAVVTDGFDALDRLQPGDRILGVSLADP